MKKFISIIAVLFTASIFFAQNYKRDLEVKKSRLHGDDVVYIQNKLIEMGFTEIGEVDGYYGPMTSGAVKDFQTLIDFDSTGIVTKMEYEFFSSDYSKLIMSAIRNWNDNKDVKKISSKKSYKMANSPSGNFAVYCKNDKTAFCRFSIDRDYFSSEHNIFKLDDNTFFVVYKESYADAPEGINPWENVRYETIEETSTYFFINGTLYSIKKGNLDIYNDENLQELVKFAASCFE